jgi:AcrR family transcriptional regulator
VPPSSGERRRILDAAAELFAKRGYHRTTVPQIARAAGLPEPVFYESFGDKEACFLALFDRLAAEGERRLAEALEANGGPWPDQLLEALRVLFDLAETEPLLVQACLSEALSVGPAAVERYEGVRDDLSRLLRSGRALKLRGAELPETLEDTLAGGVLWMIQQRLLAGQAEHLGELLPEALHFLVTPYVGEEGAARLARRAADERHGGG